MKEGEGELLAQETRNGPYLYLNMVRLFRKRNGGTYGDEGNERELATGS